SQFQAIVVHVNGKDLWATGDLCGHDGAQPHGSATIHSNGGPELGFQAVQYRTCTCLNPAAQGTQQCQVDIFVDFDYVAFVRDGMCGERGLTKEGVDGCSTLMQPAGMVAHVAAEI